MSLRGQKLLAILGVLATLGVFCGANAQLLIAAIRSQPDCVDIEGRVMPAKRAC